MSEAAPENPENPEKPESPAPETPAPETPREPSPAVKRALEFALALRHEDDIPEPQVRVFGEAVVVLATTDAELDRLQAHVLTSPSRARFRDVPVTRALDPQLEVEFQREDEKTVVAREKLWRILRQLDDEIAQALSASQNTPKDTPGKRPCLDFVGRLRGARDQIARHHGICYSNTLANSHERINDTIIRRAVYVARSAGIRVVFEE